MCKDISRSGGADLCGCEVASVDPSPLGGRGEEAAVIEAGEGSVVKSVCVEVGLGGLVGCEEKRRGFGDM